MKVTEVETIIDPRHPLVLWVLLRTDDGSEGLGETVGQARATARIVHDLIAPLLIGEDPFNIEATWHRAFRSISYQGAGGAELRALSAVDIALWDHLGKATGQPLYVLLGGACRSSVPVYNTCGDYAPILDRIRFLEDPAGLATELVAAGIRAMKIWPFDDAAGEYDGQHISAAALSRGVARLAAIRAAVGDRIEVAIEGHGLWNFPAAVRIARAVEEYKPLWLEDMTWPDNPETLVQLRAKTSVPIVASERLQTRFGFRSIIESGAADIVMPDVAWVGGITEVRKVASHASTHLLPVAPHNCGGPVNHMVNLHFCASLPNLLLMETVRAFYRGFFGDLVTSVPIPEHGAIPLPIGDGLGVQLLPDLLKRTDLLREITTRAGAETLGLARGDPWATTKF